MDIKNIKVLDKKGRELSPCSKKIAWVLVERKRAIQIDANTIKIVVDKNDIKKMKQQVVKRDNRTCFYCGKVIPLDESPSVDHLRSKHISNTKKTGYDSLDNMTCSCLACNRNKGTIDFNDYCYFRISLIFLSYHFYTNVDIHSFIALLNVST